MDYIEPFTFNAARSFIGGIVLLPVIFFQNKTKSEKVQKEEIKKNTTYDLIIGGISCGIMLCIASAFQQIGVKYTSSVGKAGFITACYIVIVPVLQIILNVLANKYPEKMSGYEKKEVGGIKIAAAIILAVIGLYLLCINEKVSVDQADLIVLVCALFFSFHIIVIDHFSPRVDGVQMSCIQFFVAGILSGILAFIFETPSINALLQGWAPVLYAGALSSGVGYTLQIIGQRDFNPAIASLILSLESCISVIAAWIILGQVMSGKEITGCIVMFAAIILAQLPDYRRNNEKKTT